MTGFLVFLSARDARLAESCASGLERLVDKLIERPRYVSQHVYELPVVGEPVITNRGA
jgi:hypothetical protein